MLMDKNKTADSISGYFVRASANRPVTFQVDGDLGSDTITIKGSGETPSEETTLYDSDGNALVLSASKPMYTFYGPAKINIAKGSTTNDVGLMELKF